MVRAVSADWWCCVQLGANWVQIGGSKAALCSVPAGTVAPLHVSGWEHRQRARHPDPSFRVPASQVGVPPGQLRRGRAVRADTKHRPFVHYYLEYWVVIYSVIISILY